MISGTEANIQRRNTFYFIAADAEDVVLQSRSATRNSSGGVTYTDDPALPSQRMRLIPTKETGPTLERETLDGRLVKPEYVLLGTWDASMERGMRFSLQGNRYEVVYVHEKRDYETKGEVVFIGR